MTLALQPRSPTIASMLTAKDAGQGGCSDLLFVDLKTLGTLIGSKYSSKSGGPKVLTTPGHLELRIMLVFHSGPLPDKDNFQACVSGNRNGDSVRGWLSHFPRWVQCQCARIF